MNGDFAGMVVAGIFMMIPIVAILTAHQRKMAEIIHRDKQPGTPANDLLAYEMRELRQAIHQQTLAIDSLTTKLESSGRLTEVSERLGQSNLGA